MASGSLITLAIPSDYGYVVLTATATFFLTLWHGFRVGPYRKAAGIGYPIAYAFTDGDSAAADAPDAASTKALDKYLFNCAQRAHANYLENLPITLTSLFLAGIEYPKAASVLMLIWGAGRVAYATGYTDRTQRGGKGRMRGTFQYIGALGLIGLTGKVGYDILMRGI